MKDACFSLQSQLVVLGVYSESMVHNIMYHWSKDFILVSRQRSKEYDIVLYSVVMEIFTIKFYHMQFFLF